MSMHSIEHVEGLNTVFTCDSLCFQGVQISSNTAWPSAPFCWGMRCWITWPCFDPQSFLDGVTWVEVWLKRHPAWRVIFHDITNGLCRNPWPSLFANKFRAPGLSVRVCLYVSSCIDHVSSPTAGFLARPFQQVFKEHSHPGWIPLFL